MKKLKILIITLLVSLNVGAYSLFDEFETTISKIDGDKIYFDMLPNIRIGASGIIVKVINSESSFIISSFVIMCSILIINFQRTIRGNIFRLAFLNYKTIIIKCSIGKLYR